MDSSNNLTGILNLEVKRKIISSMYRQNLTFDGLEHRSIGINEIIGNTLLINNALGVKKNWTSAGLSDLSSMMVATVQIPNYFLSGLRLIADLD